MSQPTEADSGATPAAAAGAAKRGKQGYGADPTHAYGLITPRFWHGMLPGDYLRMAWRNGFAVSPRGALTTGTIVGVGLFHLAGGAAQRLVHGRRLTKRSGPSAPPLFVLGHWRSGTTLLHELLIRDPANNYPTTYQCFAPHHALVSERWVTPLIRGLLPKKRPMDNVATGWDRPQEDEFALCSLGLPTPYRSWAFPRNGPVDPDWLTLDSLSDAERTRWKDALRRFVATLSLREPHRRVVLKSPPHTARVKTLLEAFPDARFVHIARDPQLLFPSTVRLWKSLCDVQSLQWAADRYDWIEEEVLSNLERIYAAYAGDRDAIPAGRLAELKYEDLVADPKAALRDVYERLQLGDFAAAERGVDAYLAQERDYKTNRYTLPDDVRETVATRWRDYAAMWGYA